MDTNALVLGRVLATIRRRTALVDEELAADRLGQFWPEEGAGGVRSWPAVAPEQAVRNLRCDVCREGVGVAGAEPAFADCSG